MTSIIVEVKQFLKEYAKDSYSKIVLLLDVIAIVTRYVRKLFLYNSFVAEVLLVLFLIGISFVALIDHTKKLIPNTALLLMLVLWIVIVGGFSFVRPIEGIRLILSCLFGAFFSGATFFLCYIFTKGQLGGGDVKLSFLMGLYLNTERIFPTLIYGMIICCVYSFCMLVKKKITLKDQLPLVPFLHLGFCIVVILI